ncbi:MAG: hypothetical protein L6R39_005154 [Caloplaca ligustica]|nr:MAG: hypothetical protein L6R39_005154 [Caloplaca ligustica]
MHGAKLRSSATGSRDAAIRPLPEEVAVRIKSSAIITSLENVVVELFKNALDAGSRRIDITVDFGRGACTVEDDGWGISPAEFLGTGGLGKPFHTSKNQATTDHHGGEGTFLASLAAMSILKITSHHHTNRSTTTLIFQHGRPAARLVPAPAQHQLLNRDHGTKVEIHDLFGNMPVRVKQRGMGTTNQVEHGREWESIRRKLTGLLLAWHSIVDVTIMASDSNRKITVKSKRAAPEGVAEDYRPSKPFDVGGICSLLSQAGYIEANTWDTWIKTSARTPFITIRGAFSLQPVESKRTQFISLGIQHLDADSSATSLYDEVNRIFALSSFGNLGVSSDNEDVKGRKVNDRRYKIDGHTKKQIRGTGKGVDRWPMFIIRIHLQEDMSRRFLSRGGPEQQSGLASIVKVLGALVTGFLSDHHLRPRMCRKRRRLVGTRRSGSSSVASGSASSPTVPKRQPKDAEIGTRASKVSNDTAYNRDLRGYTVQMPKFGVDRALYIDEGMSKWSRIKSGTHRVVGDRLAASDDPLKKGGHVSGSTPSLEIRKAYQTSDPRVFQASDQRSDDGCLDAQDTPEVHDSENPKHDDIEAVQDGDRDDTFTWTNPMTKEIISVNSRTGLAVPCPQRPRSSAAGSQLSATFASPAVSGSCGNTKLSRCTSTPSIPKAGSWLRNFLEGWENPIFAPSMEQGIPQASLEGPNSEASVTFPSGRHRCSHNHVERTFSTASAAVSSRLSKIGIGKAKLVSQVDRKFILILAEASPQNVTQEQTSTVNDQQILVLIDQHAADERIRVENLLAGLCASPSPDTLRVTSSFLHKPAVETTLLSTPLCFQIKNQEYSMFTTHAQHFAQWGVLFDLHPPCTVPISPETAPCKITIKALPPVIAERCRLEPRTMIELLRKEVWRREEDGTRTTVACVDRSETEPAELVNDEDTTDWVTQISTCPQGILDMVNSRSCRSAIMFNDELNNEECQTLVQRLARCKFPFQCAHGRPSMVPLVAFGDGLAGTEGFLTGGNGLRETDEADEGFAEAWKKWKG